MMSTMPHDEPTRHLDPYTETVALDCARCGTMSDVHDDATTDGDPCPRCSSQATTAVVVDIWSHVVRLYVAPAVVGLGVWDAPEGGTFREVLQLTTTYFPARPTLNQPSHIRVTGPNGTDLVPTGYSSGHAHRAAAEHYLANRGLTADLGTPVPVPGGSGYVFTIKTGI